MTTKDCNVSIIIPCYNQAPYLGEAVQSALNQTYQDFEIIIVDDGSTDNTSEVASSFGKFVRYIYQSNGGLSAARNTGIREAIGKYICFLDADDLLLPQFLEVLTPILDREPRLGAVYCGSQFVSAQGELLPQKIMRTCPPDMLHDVLIDGDLFPVNAVLVRRSVFQEVGTFDESLNASEDWDMWLRISACHLFSGVPNILALYRMHESNMSRNLKRMLESQLQVVRKHFGSEIGDPCSWTVERQRAYAGIYLWQAIAHCQQNEPRTSAEYVRRAFVTSPGVSRSLDTYYALFCAEQLPGHMGDYENLDLIRNGKRVLAVLDMIFADAKIPMTLRSHRQMTYGMAYFALGILAYGQRNLGYAQKCLIRAVINHPTLAVNRQWALTFSKALLGRRLLNILLDWKKARAITV